MSKMKLTFTDGSTITVAKPARGQVAKATAAIVKEQTPGVRLSSSEFID